MPIQAGPLALELEFGFGFKFWTRVPQGEGAQREEGRAVAVP